MRLSEAMLSLAVKWHDGVSRKYTREPYVRHVISVSHIYHSYFPADEVGTAAALGHDLFEDTKLTSGQLVLELAALFPFRLQDVGELLVTITELTNVFIAHNYQELNRKQRKNYEDARLGTTSSRAQNIKLCDILDNTKDIVQHAPEFACIYLPEKQRTLTFLTQGDMRLRQRVLEQITAAQHQLTAVKSVQHLGGVSSAPTPY
jgi:(p)ppGpp synthase/HD superfamily hydrolase